MFQTATLPVSIKDGVYLDVKQASDLGEKLSGEYCFAEPFPHIVIDDFLPKDFIDKILNNFPTNELEGDVVFELGYAGLHKRQVAPINCNGFTREVFGFFNSVPIVQFLESLTAIPSLIPDPHFTGGGFHETSAGGKLGIHADFRINESLHLNRRINMIIYLNKEWQDEWGGKLELWDKKMQGIVSSVAPIYNRCVIFNTDADSFHGHPDPLLTPDGVTRKSLALYYYTASKRVYEDTVSHGTMYKARPTDDVSIRKEARDSAINNYMKDLTPPAVYRVLRKIKDKFNL